MNALSLISLLLVVLAVAFASPATKEVENGFYRGRSGDAIIKPSDYVPGESFVALLNKPVPISSDDLPETIVGDLISHLSGVAPINPHVNRAFFPKQNFLERPQANMFIAIESRSSATSEMKALSGIKQYKLSEQSYPSDAVSTLTSILTGTTPSKHGIIQEAWFNKYTGMEESAFVSRRASSRVPTFQDIVGLTFRGQSLQISASADFSLANAIAPRSGLKQRYNSHSLFWDGLSLKFTSIDGSDSIISLSSESVKAFAAQQGSYNAENGKLEIAADGQTAYFDLTSKVDIALFAELSFAQELIRVAEINPLARDSVPDFYSIVFSALSDVQDKYGVDSVESNVAIGLIDAAISKVMSQLSSLYSGKVLGEVVSIRTSSIVASEAVKALITQTTGVPPLYLPQVYFAQNVNNNADDTCQNLETALASQNIEVFCLEHGQFIDEDKDEAEESQQHLLGSVDEQQQYYFRALRSSNSTDGPTDDDVAEFQIVVWTSVLLIATIAAVVVVMATSHNNKDGFLYNQPTHAKSS